MSRRVSYMGETTSQLTHTSVIARINRTSSVYKIYDPPEPTKLHLRGLEEKLSLRTSLNLFFSYRYEPCFPLQNYRFSAQIDSNRWSVRKRTIDRYNCRIRNISIPVIDLSRFLEKVCMCEL